MNRELICGRSVQKPLVGNMCLFIGSVISLQSSIYGEQKEETNTHLVHMLNSLFTVRGAATGVMVLTNANMGDYM